METDLLNPSKRRKSDLSYLLESNPDQSSSLTLDNVLLKPDQSSSTDHDEASKSSTVSSSPEEASESSPARSSSEAQTLLPPETMDLLKLLKMKRSNLSLVESKPDQSSSMDDEMSNSSSLSSSPEVPEPKDFRSEQTNWEVISELKESLLKKGHKFEDLGKHLTLEEKLTPFITRNWVPKPFFPAVPKKCIFEVYEDDDGPAIAEEYRRQILVSGGFDVDVHYNKRDSIVPLEVKQGDGGVYNMVAEIAKFAMDEYNKDQQDDKYEFLDLVKTNYQFVGFGIHYLTFRAYDGDKVAQTFQAKVARATFKDGFGAWRVELFRKAPALSTE